jgi:hypothetical protein
MLRRIFPFLPVRMLKRRLARFNTASKNVAEHAYRTELVLVRRGKLRAAGPTSTYLMLLQSGLFARFFARICSIRVHGITHPSAAIKASQSS